MKERKGEMDEGKISGFFDRDSEFNGELIFRGSFRIDGNFKGKINSESMLVVGDTGRVEAEIKAGRVVVNGEVKGSIQALETVEIHGKGRVIGSINTPRIIVEDGAYLEVTCQTTESAESRDSKSKEDVF
ncbi:MAG: polymer-forming cytoskeletal protein [Candidatus Aminicenantes bacterium]|nr:polymer-forming cytoskeletal protein [Candidatus Aminicenantes bacterium]